LNKQEDTKLTEWPLVHNMHWGFTEKVDKIIEEKYFADVVVTKRDFHSFGIAVKPGQHYDIGFYGCDGETADDIGGYKRVFISNMYGRRMQKHFACGHNFAKDPQILLTIKSIGGLPVSALTADEQEAAAKAIEVGYIKKENDTLYPKILVSENNGIYWNILHEFFDEIEGIAESVAHDIHGMIKKYVPKHLIGEYKLFVQQTSSGLLDGMIEKCIELGTLVAPERTPSAEGVIMVVTK